jgi:hypothetical protein
MVTMLRTPQLYATYTGTPACLLRSAGPWVWFVAGNTLHWVGLETATIQVTKSCESREVFCFLAELVKSGGQGGIRTTDTR